MSLALDCAASLTRVLVGVAAAAALGILFGLLRSALPERIKRNKLVRFLIEAPKFPPPIAWIPFVILWFGIGELSAYVIVFIGSFAPIFIAAYDGAESVPHVFRQTAASLEIQGTSYLRRIVFMNALPHIFSGLRAGVSMGWMSVIAAEMISGQSGLGYAIQLNRLNLQYELMVVDMIMIGVIGFLLFEMIIIAERFAIPWNERAEKL
jgi:NitT/TauT family transport system permease protein/sulfonate transport system permease protein